MKKEYNENRKIGEELILDPKEEEDRITKIIRNYEHQMAIIEMNEWKSKYLQGVYKEDPKIIDELFKKHIITKEEVKIARGGYAKIIAF